MSKRIRLSVSPGEEWETDWSKCFLCQADSSESLVLPEKKKNPKAGSGYTSLARNIPEFHLVNDMPIALDIRRIDDGDGIESTLVRNKARYHESCRLKFNNTKLQRAQKRQGEPKEPDPSETSVTPKFTRSSAKSEVKASTSQIDCFLCEGQSSRTEGREAMSFKLNEKLKKVAQFLQDEKLIAKLSAGDVMAQEFEYHPTCLTALYNKERALLNQQRKKTLTKSDAETRADDLVLAELITHITETQRNSSGGCVFKLADLSTLYESRLKQFGITDISVNTTRLKEKILAKIPELQAYSKGRNVLLAFEKDVGPALATACTDNDAMHLVKTAEIVRREMLQHSVKFEGRFDEGDIEDAVPPSLLELVSMIEHGPDIESQLENGVTKSDQAIAQLLQYNCHKKAPKDSAPLKRHSSDRETPFAVYVGLLLFAKTRKRQLIDTLFQYGICISYDRVLEISTQLGEAVIQRYLDEGVVCPPIMRKGIFTTSAVDNIDHNPSATTAMSSFHGTGISLFQHPTDDSQGEDRTLILLGEKPKSKKILPLPESYTNVRPAYLKVKPEPPVLETPATFSDQPYIYKNIMAEYEWLEHVNLTADVVSDEVVSWSAYHASQKRGPRVHVSVTSLMPLLQESAHSVATIKHSMDKIKEATNFLNPGQTPVMAVDQPLFALAKQIQWQWPESYGEDKFIVMFGGLHIEMASLKLLGDLLKGSGWTGALAEAEIATSGTADSFLSASNVAKTRQAHLITACSLYDLMKVAFSNSEGQFDDKEQELKAFTDWCKTRQKQSPQFQFWSTILSLELLVFCFVRAYRESDFQLYREALSELIPYFFALDHINYARWLPVHLRDMLALERLHPGVYTEFSRGHFAVRKTEKAFSSMAIDQAHEQNNAVIKGDGGAIGLTEDKAALRRWMVAGPEISRIVDEFSDISGNPQTRKSKSHHEETLSFQKDFLGKVSKLKNTISELGNPFEEDSTDLYALDTKEVADSSVKETMDQFVRIGQKQYETFVKAMVDSEKPSFNEPVTKNKLPLFSRKSKPDPSSAKRKLDSLKDDCHLFSRLFISCQSRKCDLQDFFRHENQTCPPSLSQNGMLNSGVKSKLLEILEEDTNTTYEEPHSDTVIIDGAFMVNAKPPGAAKTFDDYADGVIVPHIESYAERHSRVDVVFDVYRQDSLKGETRQKRGSGARRKVVGNSRPPKSWNTFLRCDENKTELFGFLADKMMTAQTNKKIIVTKDADIVCNLEINKDMLAPCNHEEADSRLFVHAKHASSTGSRTLTIVSSDTDVVVLAISVFTDLNIDALWLAFGKGKDFRWIPVHDVCKSLGPRSKALPFFHAFTGCDTVSAFVGKGKKSAWQAWNVDEAATEVFRSLSIATDTITESEMDTLEQFVVIMYDRSSETCKVDEARFDLFARKQRAYDAIPPTKAALKEHVKRAIFQAGHVWGQATVTVQQLPSPSNWGWVKQNNVWVPKWTELSAIAECCQEIQKCGCKRSSCTGNCKCYRSGLRCTALCSCNCQKDE